MKSNDTWSRDRQLTRPRRYGSHLVAFAVVLLTLGMASRATAAEGWKAGAARAAITPEGPMWMSGYASRDRPADGTRTELWAKALVLEDAAGNRGLLITLDLVGIGRELSVSLCDRLSERLGLRRDEIAICTSHTHTGPVVGGNLSPMHRALLPKSQRERVDAYAAELEQKVVDVAGQALSTLEPVEIRRGTGAATFAVNRRNNPEADVPALRTAGTLAGPVDHDVPVLSVTDADGDLTAVVFGYACHATVLSDYQWSGDYPGFAQAELEKLHPGCQTMFWAGCGGDQNPLPRRSPQLARHYGRRLADAVDSVLLTTEMSEVAPELDTSYREIDLEFSELPDRESLRRSAEAGNRYEQARANMLLARLDAGEKLSPAYPYPIAVWRLGDRLDWVFLGGEVVVDYALRLKQEHEGPMWVTAYANDVMAYIASRRVLREGGYEGATAMVYYGLPTTWAPTIENVIVTEVRRQVDGRATSK